MGDILNFKGLHKKRLINSGIYGKMYIRRTVCVQEGNSIGTEILKKGQVRQARFTGRE